MVSVIMLSVIIIIPKWSVGKMVHLGSLWSNSQTSD
jgi:hypothetical protein